MKVSHKKNLKTVSVATKRTSSRRAGARKQKVVSYAEAPSDSDTEANSSSSEEEEDVFPGKTATSRALKNKTNKVSTKKKKPPANKKTKASVKQPPSPPPPVELPPGFHETVMNKSVTSVARDKSSSPSPPKDWRVWGAMDY